MTLHYITVQNITLHYILHITLHISLHITLHYITYYITYYITLHYIILHVILHYITLHYMCIYTLYILYIYIYMSHYVCVCCVYIYIYIYHTISTTRSHLRKGREGPPLVVALGRQRCGFRCAGFHVPMRYGARRVLHHRGLEVTTSAPGDGDAIVG